MMILYARRTTLLLTTLMLMGCRDSGPQSIHVRGRVTFRGQPVPAGSIVFQSTGDAAEQRSRSVTPIENGSYDTQTNGGRGIVPGSVRVFVEGYDGRATATRVDEPSLGNPLFPPYETVVTIDDSSAAVDIDVK